MEAKLEQASKVIAEQECTIRESKKRIRSLTVDLVATKMIKVTGTSRTWGDPGARTGPPILKDGSRKALQKRMRVKGGKVVAGIQHICGNDDPTTIMVGVSSLSPTPILTLTITLTLTLTL